MIRAASGSCLFSKRRTVNRRGVQGRYAPNRGVEFVKDLFLQSRGNLRAHAAEGFVFFDNHRAMGFPDGIQDRLFVQRANRAEVHHFGVYLVLGCEKFGGFQAGDNGPPVRNQSDIRSLAFDVSDTRAG